MLVCGGRHYNDIEFAHAALNVVHHKVGVDVVISGGAVGADYLGELWAEQHGIPVERYPAQWHVYGRSAGLRRNEQMLCEGKPDIVVALPGGRGTAYMVRIAKAASVKVWEVETENFIWLTG